MSTKRRKKKNNPNVPVPESALVATARSSGLDRVGPHTATTWY
jgi:hypothetical protein